MIAGGLDVACALEQAGQPMVRLGKTGMPIEDLLIAASAFCRINRLEPARRGEILNERCPVLRSYGPGQRRAARLIIGLVGRRNDQNWHGPDLFAISGQGFEPAFEVHENRLGLGRAALRWIDQLVAAR